MEVQFINEHDWKVDSSQFKPYINLLKKEVSAVKGILNVIFVDDAYIQSLNRQYRKKDKPTDVLSFSYLNTPDFNEGMGLIGEVYISIPTASRQAGDYNMTLEDELNKLFVHGFLHIFGYDHETDEEFEEMNAIEKRVLGTE